MGASPLKALAYAMGGVSYMLHAHIDHVVKYQLMPDTAKGEALTRWGTIVGIKRSIGAKATGLIQIDNPGSVDHHTLISDNGKLYTATKLANTMSGFRCEALELGQAPTLYLQKLGWLS
jgi:uncharacterized phage protein gp47/JayE